eukprot:jgi/Bigna1/79809/fgenesh1_pg.65_\
MLPEATKFEIPTASRPSEERNSERALNLDVADSKWMSLLSFWGFNLKLDSKKLRRNGSRRRRFAALEAWDLDDNPSSHLLKNSSRESPDPTNARIDALARDSQLSDPIIAKFAGSEGGAGSVEQQATSLENAIKALHTQVKEDLKVANKIGAGAGSSGSDEPDPNNDATVHDFFSGECCGGDVE